MKYTSTFTRCTFASLALGLLCLLAAGLPALASETVATILSVSPKAWAERQGSKIDLVPKTPLQVKDIVSCDASGKVQILFEDDTTVTVAPGATVRLADFSFDDSKASFSMDVVSGMSRFVSGEVAKRNPKGFQVTTPQASIGIRGTDFTVQVGGDTTTAILNETSGAGLEVTNLGTGERTFLSTVGNALDISGARTMERKATPAEMASVARNTRNTGGTGDVGTLVADLGTAPKGGRGPEGPAGDSLLVGYENINSVTGANTNLNPGIPSNVPGGGPENILDIRNINGTFTASIASSESLWNKVNVSFNVNLGDAAISSGSVWLFKGSDRIAGFVNGTGAILEGGNFSVNRFGVEGVLVNVDPTSNMNGRFDSVSNGTVNVNVSGVNGDGTIYGVDQNGIPFEKRTTVIE